MPVTNVVKCKMYVVNVDILTISCGLTSSVHFCRFCFSGGQSGVHRAGDDRAGLAGQDDRPARPVPLVHRKQRRRRRDTGAPLPPRAPAGTVPDRPVNLRPARSPRPGELTAGQVTAARQIYGRPGHRGSVNLRPARSPRPGELTAGQVTARPVNLRPVEPPRLGKLTTGRVTAVR